MKKMLYLLRKPLERVNAAMFIASQSQGDVVLLDSTLAPFPHTGGAVLSLGHEDGERTISYDALVKKIFDSDETIVI